MKKIIINIMILFITIVPFKSVLADSSTDLSALSTKVTNYKNNFLNKTYPVGSIYMSTSLSTVAQVQAKFGGTWQVYSQGRTLVGILSSNSNYSSIKSAGSENHSHAVLPTGSVSSYTGSSGGTSITQNQLPIDTMVFYSRGANLYSTGLWGSYHSTGAWGQLPLDANGGFGDLDYGQPHSHTVNHSHTISFTSVSLTASNVQPYIVVYMYRRTA